MSSNKEILVSVMGESVVREIWTKNFFEAIPLTLQDFEIGALLPAMFYMFRRGYRRGAGRFRAAFGEGSGPVTIEQIAHKLAESTPFGGFATKETIGILADLLLCFNLENKRHDSGRDKDVIRVYPTHYLSAWIDLPLRSTNLRYVPELLLAILVDQGSGDVIEYALRSRTRFPITSKYENNDLLTIFSDGMKQDREFEDMVEGFDEGAGIGIDQLLTVRMAQHLGRAPNRMTEGRGGAAALLKSSQIPNQRPIATKAADYLAEDLKIFLRAYGRRIPRQSFLPMLETCIALGLSNILLSSAEMLYSWSDKHRLPERKDQSSFPLFVDCSAGTVHDLRRASEASADECVRRLRELPVILMKLRLLSHKARFRAQSGSIPVSRPDATNRINWLGQLASGHLDISGKTLDDIGDWCIQLAEQLDRAEQHGEVVELLNDRNREPVGRLSRAISMLMGDGLHYTDLAKALNSCWMSDEPHGMAVSRRIPWSQGATFRRSGVKRSIVLSNTMLDFLAHRHLYKNAEDVRSVSFKSFLSLLRDRYGLHIDRAPQGQAISEELLQRNSRILESRLRDLGLLKGVNDAERMKFIKSRFDEIDRF